MSSVNTEGGLEALSASPVRDWFARTFPAGPTPAQRAAWPVIQARAHALLIAPTGTGKTLAGFLALLDRLWREHQEGKLAAHALRCVYLSPLRSLGYDIERNLTEPLEAIRLQQGLKESPVRVAVRTGDTSAYRRRRMKDQPPHLLITTPESLSILLSQPDWRPIFQTVEQIIVDEVHSLVPTKRGADLAVSLERLAACCQNDPARLGLSATVKPAQPVARFLVGPHRPCHILEPPPPAGHLPASVKVASLLEPDEAPHRGLTYNRLLRRLDTEINDHRTTLIFANTRAFTEKLTHDLRERRSNAPEQAQAIAAHHSALDATRRREVEAALKAGQLRAVLTSTSLELGVDIGTADLAVLVGLPGSITRCLQRVGRAGHRVGVPTTGLLLAATPAELAGAVVLARSANEGKVEPLRTINAPLDVLCQQLIGLACEGECETDEVFKLIRQAAPFENLDRADFEACLSFLAGELAAPPGAYEPEPGANPRWTAPRIWKTRGLFGVRNWRVIRWLRSNVGTINSEENVRVLCGGQVVGTLLAEYAERLATGDRFVLDGRALEFRRLEGLVLKARPTAGEPSLPLWKSDLQSLTPQFSNDLAIFREEAAAHLLEGGPEALTRWLQEEWRLAPQPSAVLVALFEAQEQASEIPRASELLVEEAPYADGFSYTFHAPLSRATCEALSRAMAARLGRRLGSDLSLSVADLGWSIRLKGDARLTAADLPALLDPNRFFDDVIQGLDHGELLAGRFRHVAATAMMVLRNPEGGRTRVGGMSWVSRRLFPLVKAACPDHPLLREARREVLEDFLDAPSALDWLHWAPPVKFRQLEGTSPFTAAWIDPSSAEEMRFEPPAAALKRLHARLTTEPSPT